ncbi:ATP-binding protein [Streptomyces sp. NPDC005227]|uniref:ATP-binding protein n=1 Tax=Streptomyces sp. NPDC005227 TaxID=3364707 RepID=UPI0036ADBC9F
MRRNDQLKWRCGPVGDDWLSQRARAAEQAVPGAFDLSECVREPIHLLGGVQSYGTLVAVDTATGVVDTAAANTGLLLGVAAEDLVGAPVTRVVEPDDWIEALEATSGDEAPSAALPVTAGEGSARGTFDLSVHRSGELLVLEFEPRDERQAFLFSGFYQGVRRALARLRSASTVTDGCRTAVKEIRTLTGFDRVVAYRFDGPDGPGEVVAEEVTEAWEPWLGLWFPATDIPPQARRLYQDNWIRVITDVDDPTVRLHPQVRQSTGQPLDLSGAALRTVSAFHLEYLRNIDVRSSMSVSVMREGRLWGLIACHGAAPKVLAPEVRSACELFGAAFSLQLAAIEERERADGFARTGARAGAVAELLDSDVEASLLRHEEAFRGLTNADGVALARSGRVVSAGLPLPDPLASELSRRAALMTPGTVWATDRLPELLAADADADADADAGADAEHEPVAEPDGLAGLLMVSLGRSGEFLAWTRAERPMPREWAADPAVPVRVGPRGERLTPRGSGAVFRSVMRGRSLPWTAQDRSAALEMWRMLTGLVLRHANELGRLNDELRMINVDLDSFAHAAAHDLKEPLRGISNAATFTLEDAADDLDATSVRRLETMQRLAGRMDELLNSLLHYARLGRGGLQRDEVALDDVVDGALEVAGPRLADENVTVVRHDPLGLVRADADRLYEILVNLLVNAAKYAADRPDRTVEIAVATVPTLDGAGSEQAVLVRDNGIGIPPGRQSEVFDLFRRLHGPAEYSGGTGVGLAVVKRIVERHGGRIWLESEPGQGTAFYFTLGDPGTEVSGRD